MAVRRLTAGFTTCKSWGRELSDSRSSLGEIGRRFHVNELTHRRRRIVSLAAIARSES
jgi:hypothetical protein